MGKPKSLRNHLDSIAEKDNGILSNGPGAFSCIAFLYSLLSSSESGDNTNSDEQNDNPAGKGDKLSDNVVRENGRKKALLSRGKLSLRAIFQAARFGGSWSQKRNADSEVKMSGDNFDGVEKKHVQKGKEPVALGELPEISEPSLLLSEKARSILYTSLPALVQGRKWLLLYSTWRHGLSLSTLYRKSMLWPGPSLLVVGDRNGAVFGGLVEAPLEPTNKRKYQGTNSTFVFTNTPGHPVIFRPTATNIETGANRYFTLCSNDFLAIGGGGRFALYLDGDLLNGSSSVSETYGNPCLAQSENFEVKGVELWGFVYGSRDDEIIALTKKRSPWVFAVEELVHGANFFGLVWLNDADC